MEKHPSERYFILKSIVLNNLYGVDIMEEAVEICKLRLFLKLVAQLESYEQIEPLPDIDFNIRAGNTLVGFTSLDAVRASHDGHAKWTASPGVPGGPGSPRPDQMSEAEEVSQRRIHPIPLAADDARRRGVVRRTNRNFATASAA